MSPSQMMKIVNGRTDSLVNEIERQHSQAVQDLTSLRAICEKVLPVLDSVAGYKCYRRRVIDNCQCDNCRASIAANELRKELGR